MARRKRLHRIMAAAALSAVLLAQAAWGTAAFAQPWEQLPAEPSPSISTEPSPSTSTEPVPSTSTEPAPSISTEPAPSISTEPAPSISTEPVPSTSTEPVPSMSIESIPTTGFTPTPSPIPTAAPHDVVFHGEASTRVVWKDQYFSIMDGISAVDETGRALAVSVLYDGGFDVKLPGEYNITYLARHPDGALEKRFERSLTVYKTPEQEAARILFNVPELTVRFKQKELLLEEGVSAVNELGMPVPVYIISDGGILVDEPGEYTVTYGAVHLLIEEEFTAQRAVKVLTKKETEKLDMADRLKATNSVQRYNKYMRYRKQVEQELTLRMAELNEALRSRVNRIGSMLAGEGEYRLVKPLALELDDSGLTREEYAALRKEQSRISDPGQMESLPLEELTADNWPEILAVYVAAGSELNVEDPLDLISLRELAFDGLERVMLDMCEITYFVGENTVALQVRGRDYEEMIEAYQMEESRQALLTELMQPEFQGVFAALTGSGAFVEETGAAADEVRKTLPEGLAVQRENVVVAARGMEGRIPYFWGGKYYELGWNAEWGLPRIVTSPGSMTSGTLRPYGLDCSGFVTWVFVNAIGDTAVSNAIGSGTDAQWRFSRSIGWDEAQPGDLAFRAMPGKTNFNHVGVVSSVLDTGDYRITHCSSVDGTVVTTDAWSSGFRYMRRPYLYGETP